METEITQEQLEKIKEYFELLKKERFNLWDDEAVKKLAQKLKDQQAGWLDLKIASKTVVFEYRTSIPDCYFANRNTYYYDYLIQQKPESKCEIKWFVITIPVGVIEGSQFIEGYKKEHLEMLELVRNELKKQNLGEILYYELNQSAIIGLVKVYSPVEDHSKAIQDVLQHSVNQMYKIIYSTDNVNWAANLSKLWELDDIRVMLQNKNNELS